MACNPGPSFFAHQRSRARLGVGPCSAARQDSISSAFPLFRDSTVCGARSREATKRLEGTPCSSPAGSGLGYERVRIWRVPQEHIQNERVDAQPRGVRLPCHPFKWNLGQAALRFWVASADIRMDTREPDVLDILSRRGAHKKVLPETTTPFVNGDSVPKSLDVWISMGVGKRLKIVECPLSA